MTAVDHFVRRLKDHDVHWMATLCGYGLDPLFAAASAAGIRLIDTRNEQTASYIADYAGRLTRRPGVCAVSSGIGHVNALSGLVNAWFDGSPMLLISGAGPHTTAGMGHFQDCDQVALAAPAARYARVIDSPERTIQILDEALEAALHPRPGPVHLTFPMDVQTAEVGEGKLLEHLPAAGGGCEADDDITPALREAERPVIIAGSALYYARETGNMLDFAEAFAIPVAMPIWDRGAIDRPSESFIGFLGSLTGSPDLLAEADCLILAGAVPDYRLGFLQSRVRRNGARVLRRVSDWKAVARDHDTTSGKRYDLWLTKAWSIRDRFRRGVRQKAEEQARQGTHAVHILDALHRVITDETVLVIDGGSIGQWAHHLLCDRYPGHWLSPGRSGVVGYGIGGAMAARLAYPDRPVILLAGDGAFTFNVAELECAVRQSLPFVAVVADDQGWGITRAGHLKKYGASLASSLGVIAIDRLAESLGARGIRVESPEAIEPALREALAAGGVTVLHVPIVGGNPV